MYKFITIAESLELAAKSSCIAGRCYDYILYGSFEIFYLCRCRMQNETLYEELKGQIHTEMMNAILKFKVRVK